VSYNQQKIKLEKVTIATHCHWKAARRCAILGLN